MSRQPYDSSTFGGPGHGVNSTAERGYCRSVAEESKNEELLRIEVEHDEQISGKWKEGRWREWEFRYNNRCSGKEGFNRGGSHSLGT